MIFMHTNKLNQLVVPQIRANQDVFKKIAFYLNGIKVICHSNL